MKQLNTYGVNQMKVYLEIDKVSDLRLNFINRLQLDPECWVYHRIVLLKNHLKMNLIVNEEFWQNDLAQYQLMIENNVNIIPNSE